MPVVIVPDVFINPATSAPTSSEVRVEGRTVREVVDELFCRYPRLATRFHYGNGQPALDWFGLCREQDDYNLRETPELILGEDDRIDMINLIGC